MRAFNFTLALLVVLLVAAVRLPSAASINVPYKWCGGANDDASVISIEANEFPPVPGDMLILNVTANISKPVTDGEYKVAITWDTLPLSGPSGNVSDFYPLPWPLGVTNITYSQAIPSEAPKGVYVVTITATDQNKNQIFCFSLSFTISLANKHTDGRAVIASGEGGQRVLGGKRGVFPKFRSTLNDLINGRK